MDQKILIGSIIIIALIVFASFTSVVSAQATKTTIVRISFFQQMKDKIENKVIWSPGHFLDLLWIFIYGFFYIIFTLFP